MRFLPENIGFATFLNCACSNALFTLCPPLGYNKDMCPRNPGISTVPGFFHAHFYSGNKKICRSVGRDLNYQHPVLEAGFASFSQVPPFFVVLEM